MFYVVRFGKYRFNFNRFIFHLLVRFFHILLLLQTLKAFGFLQIYLNTKLLFHGSYQGSLVNENLLGWLPWLHVRLAFLHIQKKSLEFLLMRIPWCQMLFCFSKIIYFTFILDEYIWYMNILCYTSNYSLSMCF